MADTMRLSKRLIQILECSRSEAEKYIEGGWVLVDGEIIDEPQFQVLDQEVKLHPKASLAPSPPMTILLNMPEGFDGGAPSAALKFISRETRSATDSPVIRTLKRHFARLKSTAPLVEGATGLMVFTQDGRVVKRLVENASKNEQEYIVDVSGDIEEDGIEKLNQAMTMSGWPLPKAKVSWQNEKRLRFALKNVRQGQLEFMCENVGLHVEAMTRIRIGRVPMSKLEPGQWRYLPLGTLF